MSWYMYLLIVWLLSGVLLSALAVLVSKTRRARAAIIVVFVLQLGLTLVAPLELLSRPKPVAWAFSERHTEEADILGVHFVEGEAIFVMLLVGEEPRLYEYPWSDELAQGISEAQRQAEEQGTSAVLGKPFEGADPLDGIGEALGEILGEQEGTGEDQSFDDQEIPNAYPRPFPPLPPKNGGGGSGTIYERDGGD